jgi:hypothetical protein
MWVKRDGSFGTEQKNTGRMYRNENTTPMFFNTFKIQAMLSILIMYRF